MHCYGDGADVGSLMVQMGLARAADPYYRAEEGYAQAQHRGIWRPKQGTPLQGTGPAARDGGAQPISGGLSQAEQIEFNRLWSIKQ